MLGGCATDLTSEVSPRMPTMLPAPAVAPTVAISRQKIQAAALAAVERDDVPAAVRELETVPFAQRSDIVREMISTVAARDPMRAGRVALALPVGMIRNDAVKIAARAMTEREPLAAVAWAIGVTEREAGFFAVSAVGGRLVEEPDQRPLLQRVQDLPAASGRDDLLSAAAAQWARRDATTALAWVDGLAGGDLKARLLTSVGFEIAQTMPERAVEIAQRLPESRDRRLLIGAIGQTWVVRDAPAATAWARRLPAGPAREAAFTGIASGLGVTAGPRSVVEPSPLPLSNVPPVAHVPARPVEPELLPPGPERERAIRQRFDTLLQTSPTMTGNWMTQLPAADRSQEMVDRLAREWLATNPAAAKQWIDMNVISPVQREELLRYGPP